MLSAAPCVGIDVSKATLAVAVGEEGRVRRFDNTPAGHRALARHLAPLAPARIVLEATGGYESRVLRHLAALRLNAVRVNPRRVRDARVLARFGARMSPELRPLPAPEQEELRELVRRRRQLVRTRATENNRLETTASPGALRSIRRMVSAIDKQIEQMEAEIAGLIAAHERLKRKVEIVDSIPGVGLVTAAILVAGLPELGELSRQAMASLAGLAPFNDDSGAREGQRSIRGGRPHVRTALYMTTLSAARHNPAIRATYARLVGNGKPPKVALTACMRKLLTVANALVRDNQLWTHRSPNESEPTA